MDLNKTACLLVRCLYLPVMCLGLALPPFVPFAQGAQPVRYVQYWASYGNDIACANGYQSLSLGLMNEKASIFMGKKDGLHDNFVGIMPDAMHSELSELVASLDLSKWDVPIDEAGSDKIPYEERKKYCRWGLTLIFEPDGPGKQAREAHLAGADYGQNPGRLADEKKLADFFGGHLKNLQRAAPKKIENVYWNMPGDGGHSYYRVSRTDNGRVEVSRRRGANKTSAYVRTALLDELQKALNPYAVDAWHGFSMPGNGPNDPLRMEFSLKYDTLQNVYARSVMGQEGDVPEGMEELSAKLSALCDRTLDACGGPLPKRADALKSFSFGERGMRMGSWPGYEIYQRMETDGPVMVLERELGLEKTECLISDAELQDFERLLKKTGIIGWNGFSGSNRNVLDGTSFRLHAGFWDGRNIRAEGYMRFPKGYRDAMEQVYAHLNAVLAKKSMQHD